MVSFALKSDLYYTPHAGLTWLIDECPPCMVPANDEHTKPYASHRLVSGVLFTFDGKDECPRMTKLSNGARWIGPRCE